MVKSKTIVVGLLIVFAILAVVVVASTRNPTTTDVATSNGKAPPETQLASEQTSVQTLTLSDGTDTDSVTCQQPPKGNEYGGISGVESNPPRGTAIDQGLTTQYGEPTATGVCGTYWYIAGWWFNASEMAKLPSETLLYKVSPYAMAGGSDDSSSDNEDEKPVIPIPEVATIFMVAFGIFAFVVWNKTRK